jgi:hypothetical protein
MRSPIAMTMPESQTHRAATTHRLLRWGAVVTILLTLILVPFALFEDPMNALSVWLVARDRPPAVARLAVALLLAADVGFPFRRASSIRLRARSLAGSRARSLRGSG